MSTFVDFVPRLTNKARTRTGVERYAPPPPPAASGGNASLATLASLIAKTVRPSQRVSRHLIKSALGTKATAARINIALNRAVTQGKLVQIGGSYQCPAPKPKPAPKAAPKAKASSGKPRAAAAKKANKGGKAKAPKAKAKASSKVQGKAASATKAAKAAAKARTTKKKASGKKARAPVGTGSFDLDEGVAAVNTQNLAFTVVPPYSSHMAQVNMATNTDKFYVLQMLGGAVSQRVGGMEHYVFSRWGRTGTRGQQQLKGPFSQADATKLFQKTFREKTGVDFKASFRTSGLAATTASNYSVLKEGRVAAGDGLWEYYLTNDMAMNGGKPDGWYPYDASTSAEVDMLYQIFKTQDNTGMSVRSLYAPSNGFSYRVDLVKLTQTNVSSGTSRPIRRVAK